MNEKLPFGLQFEVARAFAPHPEAIHDPANGITWVETEAGLQPLVDWEWWAYAATSTRNHDDDVERPPTTTITEQLEPSE